MNDLTNVGNDRKRDSSQQPNEEIKTNAANGEKIQIKKKTNNDLNMYINGMFSKMGIISKKKHFIAFIRHGERSDQNKRCY